MMAALQFERPVPTDDFRALLADRPLLPAPRYEMVEAMPVRQFLLYASAGICIGTAAVLCVRPFFMAVVVIAEALR